MLAGLIKKEGGFEQQLDFVCLAMIIYLRDIALNKESSLQIVQIYERFPTIDGTYLEELLNLSWALQDVYEEDIVKTASLVVEPRPTDLHFITKEYLDQS